MNGQRAASPRVAEFFAGIGLVRMALEQAGCRVVFANDISETKRRIYQANFRGDDFYCADIRDVSAPNIPDVDIATASFPCTDVSLAGNRAGLEGEESSLVREFLRILAEMGMRKPRVVLLENVIGLATSRGGEDLAEAILTLNELGYTCDPLMVDARWFVAQSRPRLFVIASLPILTETSDWEASRLRPPWVGKFVGNHANLWMQAAQLPDPPHCSVPLLDFVEQFPPNHDLWWDGPRLSSFLSSLSPIQAERLEALRRSTNLTVATAYRRTRHSKPMWEIRSDNIAGCLRTGRGGSSRQALVQVGQDEVRVRWMTAREYARLQGAPAISFGEATEAQARFALGDAVCVPAVAWLAQHYMVPLVNDSLAEAYTVELYG